MEVRTPPPQKRGISAILARYPMKKTRQMGAIPPSAILARKGIARYGGGTRTGPLRLGEMLGRKTTANGLDKLMQTCRSEMSFWDLEQVAKGMIERSQVRRTSRV